MLRTRRAGRGGEPIGHHRDDRECRTATRARRDHRLQQDHLWAVREVVEDAGGKVVITRVGHTFVKAAMAEHDAVFEGEHSAHYYFEDFWGADTGMLAAMHVLAMAGRRPSRCPSWRPGSLGTRRRARSTGSMINKWRWTGCPPPSPVGVSRTASTGSPWPVRTGGSIPAVNTEPLLRLNVEAATEDVMAALRDETLSLIRA